MDYKIVIDSCGEVPEEWKQKGRYENVPLEIDVDGCRIVDDESFDQADFLRRVAASLECPKSSCPSPEQYLQAYERGEAGCVYAVTLSEQLSGSYNSAVLAMNLFQEKHPDRQIHVFNSRSASIGQTLIGRKAEQLHLSGKDFQEVVRETEQYVQDMNTYFVLESLETLRKNGRLTGLKAFVASALNIKPVMGATPEGTICQLSQARGINKALKKMVEIMKREVKDPAGKILAISHCNCLERALGVKREIEKDMKFQDILVLNTRGISSLYANDGGIIMCV